MPIPDLPRPRTQAGLRKTKEFFVTDSPPHSTLREWRSHITSPVAQCILGGSALILTIVAPYETDRILAVVPRLAYWLAIVVSTYSAGFLVHALLTPVLDLPKALLILSNGAVTGLAVTALVTLINGFALGYWPSLAEWPLFAGNIFVIAMIVAAILHVVSDHQAATAAPSAHSPAPPPLLDRLPFEKRGPLLALSVQDHYVSVRTTKGAEMVLIRLSDAMRETGDTPGMQVHRSHWVAINAVAAARRDRDRAILTLSDDSEIPVSRRYVAAIKKAGLLPRSPDG